MTGRHLGQSKFACCPSSCMSTPAWFGMAGPFVEADGSRRPPSFFKAYVISLPVTAGILLPAAGFLYLILQGRSYLATATLGVYLLELAAQLVSEQAFIKQGVPFRHPYWLGSKS